MQIKLNLNTILIGSCNCFAKTPDFEYHDELCYYRLLMENSLKKCPHCGYSKSDEDDIINRKREFLKSHI